MLLHCESEDRVAEEGAPWLRGGALESLTELNESCLALLAEESRARAANAPPLLRQVGELWRLLDAAARRRAATCPYLLLDAGFADSTRWLPAARQVGDGPRPSYDSYFTVDAASELAQLIFTYAWHLARSQGLAARLVLGMPAATAHLIAQYTLCQIRSLAQLRPGWLRPRWATRVEVWRELLLAAAGGESDALERVRLRGLALLAAEARRQGSHPGCGAAQQVSAAGDTARQTSPLLGSCGKKPAAGQGTPPAGGNP